MLHFGVNFTQGTQKGPKKLQKNKRTQKASRDASQTEPEIVSLILSILKDLEWIQGSFLEPLKGRRYVSETFWENQK